jgi:hypothetical protein
VSRAYVAALVAIPAFAALGWFAGRASVKPVVETKIVERKVVQWQKSEATVVATSAVAEKKQIVRVVTRWLRPDGTVSREQQMDSLSASNKVAVASAQSSGHSTGAVHSEAVSESRTVVRERPRLHLQGLLGIDAGLQRRWGAAASWRVAGPVTIGAWVLPGARTGGASVGITF